MAAKKNNETAKPFDPARATPAEIMEEVALLRQQCNSLVLRGHMDECRKTLEDNIQFLYQYERWPEHFASMLRLLSRCYRPESVSFEEYLLKLLRKNGIPFVFAELVRSAESTVAWTSEYFKNVALLCHAGGEHEKAAAYCEIMTKIDPASVPAMLLRAQMLEAAGKTADAQALYGKVLEAEPANTAARLGMARGYIARDPKRALVYVNEAIRLDPEDTAFYLLKADLLAKTGSRASAYTCLDEAMSRNPYEAALPFKKAEMLMADGSEVAAVSLYGKTLTLQPNHIRALERMAKLSAGPQPDQALAYIGRVLGAEPDNLAAMLLRGALLRRLERSSEAVIQYSNALAVDGGCFDALVNLGELQAQEYAQALDFFTRALAVEPASARCMFGMGEALIALEKLQEAAVQYKQAAELDKNDARPLARLGALYAETQPALADEYMHKALALEPENALYNADRGRIQLRLGNKKSALAYLSKCVQLENVNGAAHLDLAILLEDNGSLVSALEHYRYAVELLPADARAYYGTAHLEALRGDLASAFLHICKAIYWDDQCAAYHFEKAVIIFAMHAAPQTAAALLEAADDGRTSEEEQELGSINSGRALPLALKYATRAGELDSGELRYFMMKCSLLAEMGDVKTAIEQYRKLLARDPQNHAAMFGLAEVYMAKTPQRERALELCEKAIALSPKTAQYHALLAALLSADPKRFEQAVRSYETAVSLDKNDWRTILAYAALLEGAGAEYEARRAYRRALLVNPTSLAANIRLGEMLTDIAPDAALTYLDSAIAADEENALCHALKGRALCNLGDEVKADSCFERAIALGGDAPDMLTTIAEAMLERHPARAMAFCEQALEKAPDDANTYVLMARISLVSGDEANAVHCCERALVLSPSCHRAGELLADLMTARYDPNALDYVDRALAQLPNCVRCLLAKARLLTQEPDAPKTAIAAAIVCVNAAIKIAPSSLPARELLVALLGRSGAFLRLQAEKYRLGALRRKLSEPEPEADPPAEHMRSDPQMPPAAKPQPASAPVPESWDAIPDEFGRMAHSPVENAQNIDTTQTQNPQGEIK